MRLAHQHICSHIRPYDWIIPAEDETLKAFSKLEWPASRRPKFLSKTFDGHPFCFFSKIELSRTLSRASIQTPPFRVVSSCEDAVAAAHEFGYPVMLKVDESCGGLGARECRDDAEVIRDMNLLGAQSLLLQKKIMGREICFDTMYVQQKLAYFACALQLRAMRPLAPSSVRKYFPLPLVEKDVFDELTKIGHVFGADGLANIKCIDADNGSGRYYFEADLRSNAWMELTKFSGEDPAERIRKCFSTHASLTKEDIGSSAKCSPVVVPCFLRLKFWEFAVNRYKVWKYTPLADANVVARTYAIVNFWRLYCLVCALLPRALKTAVKRGMNVVRKMNAVRNWFAPGFPSGGHTKLTR